MRWPRTQGFEFLALRRSNPPRARFAARTTRRRAIRPRGRHGTAGAAALLTLVLLTACASAPGDVQLGAETLRTIIDEPGPEPELTVGDPVVDVGLGLDRYAVSYESEGLTITGLLALPQSEGPSPGLVVIHGYERGTYDAMTSMGSYYAPLVEAGYVVLFPDLRNYGGSDGGPAAWDDMHMSGTREAADAVRALATLPQVDPERLGVVGLSDGGGLELTTSVVVPGAARRRGVDVPDERRRVGQRRAVPCPPASDRTGSSSSARRSRSRPTGRP